MNYSSITTAELKQQLAENKLAIIDVREQKDFLSSHIPTAFNIPIDELTSTFHQLDKDVIYYVICYKGTRSAKAAAFLASQDFTIINITGGMTNWGGSTVSGVN